MPAFSYTAIDATGQRQSGSLEVASRTAAYRELERRSLTPVKVEVAERPGIQAGGGGVAAVQRAGKKPATAVPPAPGKLRRPQLILFTEELADLIDAGLQLEVALRVLAERQDHPGLRAVAAIAREDVRDGKRFSEALKKASPSFDELYRNMVAAGETSGTLPVILRRLANNLTISQELQSRVTGALVYPAFVVTACLALVVVFMTVLLPQLTEMLESTGQRLPLITRTMVAAGDIMRGYWWLLLAALVAAVLLAKGLLGTPVGRAWWDRNQLRIPLFGALLRGRFHAGFCHGLANLVNNGVPLLAGLKLFGRATPNSFYKENLLAVTGDVAEGASLSSCLRRSEAFPNLMSDLVAVGEQTGGLGRSLEKAAARYDKELDKRVGRLTSIITPVIISIIAVVVGVVALSIVTTLSQSVSGIRGG